MGFLVNLGYQFSIPSTVNPDGSIILCSAMPMHQLERRKIDARYPHMAVRYFDPQLYYAGLDANSSVKHCAKLATYPWFGVTGLQDYDSGIQTQSSWRQETEENIASIWPSRPPDDPDQIRHAIKECIDFQERFGCEAIILPSPLTVDPGTDYSRELFWIDAALDYINSKENFDIPVFATIALADFCLRSFDPTENALLDIIADSVSAREIDGVYLVMEQASEPPGVRYPGDTRSLWSLLHLVHIFSQDCGLDVGTNFLGKFGLVCEAAGATFWASGWYKSLVRLRLADALAGGRAFPSYWSSGALVDIHLDTEFDTLNRSGIIQDIADVTIASEGLIQAASNGVTVTNVPAWRYAQSNISAAKEHFLLSAMNLENIHSGMSGIERLEFVGGWLESAVEYSNRISRTIGSNMRTQISHVSAWRDAFNHYRRTHDV